MARKKKTDVVAEPVIAPASAETEEIVSIKGFDKDFKCRGFQFDVGNTYTHDGDLVICESGFHAIEGHPLEVFDYYSPATSRFAEVRQSGQIARHARDSKVASTQITISCELSLSTIIERAVVWVFARAKSEGESHHATGECGAASATGDYGAASATGDYGAASATGYQGAASATGRHGAAIASGFHGRVMGAEGNALFLVRRNDSGEITHVWAGIVGQNGVKPDTWYTLDSNGTLEEVP